METKTIPTNLRQAFKILDEMLSQEDKEYNLSQSKFEFTADEHVDLGMWIRNEWIYGPESDEDREKSALLLKSLGAMTEDGFQIEMPDMVSDKILEKYYDHLKRKSK